MLPPSVGASLMDQNAYKNGPMFFRLATAGGASSTFAGVLEFSSAEGFVALPRKVGDSIALVHHGVFSLSWHICVLGSVSNRDVRWCVGCFYVQ